MPEERRASRGDRLWEAAVVLVSAAYVIVYAWPASIAPQAWVWGSHGDGLGNIVEFSWYLQAIQQGRPTAVDPHLAIPFGENFGALPHEPLYYWAHIGIGLVAGSVVALNVISLVAPLLASWAMFRLVRWMTGSAVAAFASGIAFGCCSYILANTAGEPTLAQIWIFPATTLATLKLLDSPSLRRIVAAAVAVTVAAMVNFYYVVFLALALTALGAGWLLFRTVETRSFPGRQLAAGLAAGGSGVVTTIVLYELVVGRLAERASLIHRSSAALSSLAASPIDFLLPPRTNPWIGFLRQQVFEARLAIHPGIYTDFSELSIPVSMLLLALAGATVLLLPALRGLSDQVVHRAQVVAVAFVGLLGIWLLVPPFGRRFGLEFLSLEWDIWSLAPQYASFYRAGVLVVFAVLVVAGVALAALAVERPRAAAAIAVVAVAVMFLENYTVAADRVLAVQPLAADTWIVQHPGDYAVAEYPLLPTGSGANEYTSEFYQRFHGHALVNGHVGGTESESMRDELRDANRPGVVDVLSALNVRYVIWRPDVIKQFAPLNPSYARLMTTYEPRSPGYLAVASFDDGIRIYEVESTYSGPFAFYASGFGPVVDEGTGDWARHSNSESSSLDVYSAGSSSITAHLKFSCATRGAAAKISIAGDQWSLSPGSPVAVDVPVAVGHGVTRTPMAIAPSAAAQNGDVWCTRISISS